VQSVPAFYLFNDGKPVTSFAGADPKKLKDQIEALAAE
jgi:thioredoxin-like negative regulator of GroEL